MTSFQALLEPLVADGVEFLIIGGVAAAAHGSARATFDLDVVYRRTHENIERLVRALGPVAPYLRGAPKGLPFRWDAATVRMGLNFTLTIAHGDLVLLGEVTGGGRYEDLLPHSVEITVFGLQCRILDLPMLIKVKRAAGRPKDLEALAELELLLEERGRPQDRKD